MTPVSPFVMVVPVMVLGIKLRATAVSYIHSPFLIFYLETMSPILG